MQEYRKIIFDGDVSLSCRDINKSLERYLKGDEKITSITIGVTEPGVEFGNWKIRQKDYVRRKEYCVFYRRDLNNAEEGIDFGCIEIDFDISENKPPCHMKVVSHIESYDFWWKKFLEENLRRTEDVIVPVVIQDEKKAFSDPDASASNVASYDSGDIPKYGTDRDITGNQIRQFIQDYLRYKQQTGGSIRSFYYRKLIDYPKKFEYGTFKSWMRDSRFK